MKKVTYVVGTKSKFALFENWLLAFTHHKNSFGDVTFTAEFSGKITKLSNKVRYLTGDQDTFHEFADKNNLKYRRELTIKE